MKLRGRLIVAAALLAGGGAFGALTAGTKVFIKAKNTRVLKAPKADAAATETLQPGAEVAWQKAEGKEFHQVKTGAGTGYVLFSNLSMKPPDTEYVQGKGQIDAKSFATSGAATKALAPAAQDMEKRGTTEKEAVHDLLAAEALSQSKIGTAEVAAHAKSVGLNAAVGAETGGAQ